MRISTLLVWLALLCYQPTLVPDPPLRSIAPTSADLADASRAAFFNTPGHIQEWVMLDIPSAFKHAGPTSPSIFLNDTFTSRVPPLPRDSGKHVTPDSLIFKECPVCQCCLLAVLNGRPELLCRGSVLKAIVDRFVAGLRHALSSIIDMVGKTETQLDPTIAFPLLSSAAEKAFTRGVSYIWAATIALAKAVFNNIPAILASIFPTVLQFAYHFIRSHLRLSISSWKRHLSSFRSYWNAGFHIKRSRRSSSSFDVIVEEIERRSNVWEDLGKIVEVLRDGATVPRTQDRFGGLERSSDVYHVRLAQYPLSLAAKRVCMLGKFTSALYNLHLKCLALVRPHRNVVSHFESAYAEHGNELWIAMEYMDGGSLVDVLKKNMGRITEEQIARISLDVLQGLRHLHQCGLAHNGLKESKILFNMRGEVKIGGLTYVSKLAFPTLGDCSRSFTPGKVTQQEDVADVGIVLGQVAIVGLGQSAMSSELRHFLQAFMEGTYRACASPTEQLLQQPFLDKACRPDELVSLMCSAPRS